MAAIWKDSDDVISEINVTPFVDVVLVLLVIFMVTATVIVHPTIPVRLPEAAAGEARPRTPIQIVVRADGGLFADGAPIRISDLAGLLAGAGDPAEVPVVVSADREVAHGAVVEVLDHLRAAGARRFAVGVQWKAPIR